MTPRRAVSSLVRFHKNILIRSWAWRPLPLPRQVTVPRRITRIPAAWCFLGSAGNASELVMCKEACKPLMIFKSVLNNKHTVALCGVHELVWPDVRSLVNKRILMCCRTLFCFSGRVWGQTPVNLGTLSKFWNSWMTFMWVCVYLCFFFVCLISSTKKKEEVTSLFGRINLECWLCFPAKWRLFDIRSVPSRHVSVCAVWCPLEGPVYPPSLFQ